MTQPMETEMGAGTEETHEDEAQPRREHEAKRINPRWSIRKFYRRPGSPFWYCVLFDHRNKKRHRVSSEKTNKRQAESYAHAWIDELEAREQRSTIPSKGLEAALEEYRGTLDVRPITLEGYEQDHALYVKELGGGLVTDIDVVAIEKLMETWKKEKKSVRTRRKHLVALRSFYRWAIRRQYAAVNPCEGVKVARGAKKTGIALDENEIRRLLAACREKTVHPISDSTGRRQNGEQSWPRPKHLWRAVALAVLTALRLGNVRRLTWGQIDMAKRKITIPAEQMKANADHVVPVNSELLEILEEIVREHKVDGHKATPKKTDLVIGADVAQITVSFKAALVRAGLPETTRWHDLRHSAATLLSSRCSYAALRQLLGHSPGAVTLKYVHVPFPELLAAMESLPRLTIPAEQKSEAAEA